MSDLREQVQEMLAEDAQDTMLVALGAEARYCFACERLIRTSCDIAGCRLCDECHSQEY